MIMEDDVLVTSYWGLAGSIEDHCLIYDRISKGRYWSAPESYIVKDYINP
jgi:hypothetical protein